MERVASRAHRMGRHRWASPLKLRRHPTSATTALLLAASCGLAADVLASSCTSPAGCSVGDYCDDGSDCYECSYISRQRCDARDGDCCSAAFCHNCPSDPHGCCSTPSPSPSPGGLSCGTNCQWIYAASASYTCSTACSNHHAGWTCHSGATWPTLSRADFKAVSLAVAVLEDMHPESSMSFHLTERRSHSVRHNYTTHNSTSGAQWVGHRHLPLHLRGVPPRRPSRSRSQPM